LRPVKAARDSARTAANGGVAGRAMTRVLNEPDGEVLRVRSEKPEFRRDLEYVIRYAKHFR